MATKERLQEIFNTVYLALLAQGTACVSSENHCLYFNKETGQKCAAGWLFDKHDPRFEGYSIDELLGMAYDEEGELSLDNLPSIFKEMSYDTDLAFFIERMQKLHDIVLKENGLSAWSDKMHMLAAEHSLEIPNA